MANYAQCRSLPPQESPLLEPSSLPQTTPTKSVYDLLSPSPGPAPSLPPTSNGNSKKDLLHPAFLPPCEHGEGEEDMHAHAFDLLSLAGAGSIGSSTFTRPTVTPRPPLPATQFVASAHVLSSVPTRSSILSTSRPPVAASHQNITHPPNNSNHQAGNNGMNGVGSAPKPRRMSSSTTGVLQRGKLGLTGDTGLGITGVPKDARPGNLSHPASYSGPAPIPNRRPSATGSPQLFDFTKTDRRPSQTSGRPHLHTSRSAVPASLPTRANFGRNTLRLPTPEDDMELDMEFDGDEEDDDEGEGSGRSGSAELEMDMDMDEKGELDKLALGTGSGGIKGRRKGMVFKCEACGKEYRHPSCLVKHRWEHSPHWKEPTALSMSKHQQVQMLEAAAILAHIHPQANQGRPLPTDKSLWPMILSPPTSEGLSPRRGSRDLSTLRSPPSSTVTPLTPSSLRESSTIGNANPMGAMQERHSKERKTTPDSDSTTSSMGASEPYLPANSSPHAPSSYGGRNGTGPGPIRTTRPVGIQGPAATRRTSFGTATQGQPQAGAPGSVGSLPDMGRLNFAIPSSAGANPPNGLHSHYSPSHGVSPIPLRGGPFPPSHASMNMGKGLGSSLSSSLRSRTGLVGGGMFGAINTSVRSSSVRSGARDDELHEEEDEDGEGVGELDEEAEEAILSGRAGAAGAGAGAGARAGRIGNGKSSSEERDAEERRKGREGEEYGMAMEMEL